MKNNNDILSLHETEQLCRAYLDCRLSVLEETELRYVLNKLPYSSPLIDETRDAMRAEGILFTEKRSHKRPSFQWVRLTVGIAASLALLVTISMTTGIWENRNTVTEYTTINESNLSSDVQIIAFKDGKKLSGSDAEKAVNESLQRAEALIAMAKAIEEENKLQQENIINITSGKK